MDQAPEPNAQQNVHVEGSDHTVIVAMGDVVIGSPASLLPPNDDKMKRGEDGSSGRWFGASAGVGTFVTLAMLATWALHLPQEDRRYAQVAPAEAPAFRSQLLPTAVWPEGKSARCRDGWYSASHTRSGTCSSHGGVAQWRFPADNPYWRR